MNNSQRSLDTALTLGAKLLAYALADISEIAEGTDLTQRLEWELHNLVHEFCFYSRKVIECERVRNSTAMQIPVYIHPTSAYVSINGETSLIMMTKSPFYWVANRLVHSVDFIIIDSAEGITTHDNPICFTKLRVGGPRIIGFRSDRDRMDTLHYVEVEELVLSFVKRIAPIIDRGDKDEYVTETD